MSPAADENRTRHMSIAIARECCHANVIGISAVSLPIDSAQRLIQERVLEGMYANVSKQGNCSRSRNTPAVRAAGGLPADRGCPRTVRRLCGEHEPRVGRQRRIGDQPMVE